MKAVFGIFTRFLHYDGPRIRAYSGTLYIRAPDTRTSTTKASRCCGKATEALEFNMVYALCRPRSRGAHLWTQTVAAVPFNEGRQGILSKEGTICVHNPFEVS